jgi:hypothetical protein
MFLNEQELNANNDRTDLLGLRISAGLLAVLGCVFALYVLLFSLLLGAYVVRCLQGNLSSLANLSSILTLFIIIAVTAALTYLCFRAASALCNAERWASYVAMGFGLLFLLFSAVFFYDWFHPDRQSPDEGFGIFIVPFCITFGLWWCIYLNLPYVRVHLKRVRS